MQNMSDIDKDDRITVRIPSELKKAIEQMAADNERLFSDQVRLILKQASQPKEEGSRDGDASAA